jgi:hypothetical protein
LQAEAAVELAAFVNIQDTAGNKFHLAPNSHAKIRQPIVANRETGRSHPRTSLIAHGKHRMSNLEDRFD